MDMLRLKTPSTSRLLRQTGSLFLAALLVSAAHARASDAAAERNAGLQAEPRFALEELKVGNERFATGRSNNPRRSPEEVRAVAKGQKPFAIIVSCSDSRVPSEIIFDQGLGDLFSVRTAGQVSTYASWGSIEYAHAVLGANLIVVLGHTHCGAVSAACEVPKVPGHIVGLINDIKPAADRARNQPGDLLENAVVENVRMQVEKLKSLEPVLAESVRAGKLEVIGAVYELESGRVRFLD
jgi:carbonic anhydrase